MAKKNIFIQLLADIWRSVKMNNVFAEIMNLNMIKNSPQLVQKDSQEVFQWEAQQI